MTPILLTGNICIKVEKSALTKLYETCVFNSDYICVLHVLFSRSEIPKSLETDTVFRNFTVFEYLKNKVRQTTCTHTSVTFLCC